MITLALFWQAKSFRDNCSQLFICLRCFKLNGFCWTICHTCHTAVTAMMPNRAIPLHGNILCRTHFRANCTSQTFFICIKALVIFMFHFHVGYHKFRIQLPCNRRHVWVRPVFPYGNFSANFLNSLFHMGNHDFFWRKRSICRTLTCNATQGISIM